MSRTLTPKPTLPWLSLLRLVACGRIWRWDIGGDWITYRGPYRMPRRASARIEALRRAGWVELTRYLGLLQWRLTDAGRAVLAATESPGGAT